MPTKTFKLESTVARTAAFAAAAAVIIAAFFSAKWGFAHTLALRADSIEVAEMAVAFGPDDPQTHYTAAVLFDKTFDSADAARALLEMERAVELSPFNYNLRLELAGSRFAAGDTAGAEAELRKAAELAPHYARVRWALGNGLLRAGQYDEAFEEMRLAVAADPKYASPAATAALQMFDGDVARVQGMLGGSPELNFAFASLLAGDKLFDDAGRVWSSISEDARADLEPKAVDRLFATFVTAKQFRRALSVRPNGATIGNVKNGSFEESIRPNDTKLFDWEITAGTMPKAALSDTEKRAGNFSLLLVYAAPDGKIDRQVSQTVAVEPGDSYIFEAFYRTNISSGPGLKIKILNAMDASLIAELSAGEMSNDWKNMRTTFTVPESTDGIIIRIVPNKCTSSNCGISGNFWLDDVTLLRN